MIFEVIKLLLVYYCLSFALYTISLKDLANFELD